MNKDKKKRYYNNEKLVEITDQNDFMLYQRVLILFKILKFIIQLHKQKKNYGMLHDNWLLSF